MKSPERSMRMFGIYMILIPGLGLTAVPEFLLDIFQLSHSDNFWMARMIGLLALMLGVYYLFMAIYETTKLYLITSINRDLAAAFMVYLWVSGQVEIAILLFAAIDGFGATWTLIAINQNEKVHNRTKNNLI